MASKYCITAPLEPMCHRFPDTYPTPPSALAARRFTSRIVQSSGGTLTSISPSPTHSLPPEKLVSLRRKDFIYPGLERTGQSNRGSTSYSSTSSHLPQQTQQAAMKHLPAQSTQFTNSLLKTWTPCQLFIFPVASTSPPLSFRGAPPSYLILL